ncbi:MAG: DUF3160 domain-containing protein [Deltaproteobacteria bacterium]|nr:DUF3160 domain-containing protein [Deltaproteobacteria bacterium]
MRSEPAGRSDCEGSPRRTGGLADGDLLRPGAARFRPSHLPWALLICLGASSCERAGERLPADKPVVPGTGVKPNPSPKSEQTRAELLAILEEVRPYDREDLVSRWPAELATAQPVIASQTAGLDTIQSSALALTPRELDALAARSFVVSDTRSFPSFIYGYDTLYSQDLPLFVSADSILHAVHRSYDVILQAIETSSLIPELDSMLTGMRAGLTARTARDLGETAETDADFYLAVALSLLRDQVVAPVLGGKVEDVEAFFDAAKSAEGSSRREIFGVDRLIDFSQFTPRGHYTNTPELTRYFRAMIWLGRIDLRLLETQPDHSQKFHRRQLEGMLALHSLVTSTVRASYDRIDRAVTAFVGEKDNMTLDEVGSLLADLGVSSLSGLAAIDDTTIAQAIVSGEYGAQRISSHIMINGLDSGTMPLSSTFLLLGQRYVLDSHVFSNVVYDRVQGGAVRRMMPSPLDAAFAAFGNNQAAELLAGELDEYRYSPDLASMRILADAHGKSYWEGNLYNLWLASIRALSPGSELADPAAHGIPAVVGTEAWGRRLLNTQLASWAELRHDTILYVKQSYTGGVSCEFPDAYVEPNPELFQTLGSFATSGRALVAGLDLSRSPQLSTRISTYFDKLFEVSGILREMAEYQRAGTPFTPAMMAFINQAVRVQTICGGASGVDGWYADLYFDPIGGSEFDPTIADVHTQPTDEVGNEVGRVLHVATGGPRMMVVAFDTCTGPRAYAGLVSTYFEKITEGYERLTDEAWATEVSSGRPADVAWLSDLVVR